MGSKSKICREIIELLPPAETFLDLFAGGCAMTHAAMLSRKFKKFHLNDLSTLGIRAFLMGIRGEFKNEDRFISRSQYYQLKNTDPYVALCWGFGGKLNGAYLWSPDVEHLKGIAARLILSDNRQERMALFSQLIKTITQKNIPLSSLENLKRLQSLERLGRLQSLERLGRLVDNQQIMVTHKSYDDVAINGNTTTVYADPPYAGTGGYGGAFNSDGFWEWVRTRNFIIYVSEYSAPADFVSIWQKQKICSLSSSNNSKLTLENLFIHNKWMDEHKRRTGQLLL